MTKTEKVVYCDFCGQSQYQIPELIQGPKDIAICNECVELCVTIIGEKKQKEPS